LDKDIEMEDVGNKLSSHHITSRLIDLIIQLPEHDQLKLLQQLETRQRTKNSPIKLQPHSKTPRYASGDYIFWDLFG
jgi:hypothetical protein